MSSSWTIHTTQNHVLGAARLGKAGRGQSFTLALHPSTFFLMQHRRTSKANNHDNPAILAAGRHASPLYVLLHSRKTDRHSMRRPGTTCCSGLRAEASLA